VTAPAPKTALQGRQLFRGKAAVVSPVVPGAKTGRASSIALAGRRRCLAMTAIDPRDPMAAIDRTGPIGLAAAIDLTAPTTGLAVLEAIGGTTAVFTTAPTGRIGLARGTLTIAGLDLIVPAITCVIGEIATRIVLIAGTTGATMSATTST
jgi:hypothetical protein